MFFICRGIVASILVFLCFGVTQAKDGPFSRPHPGNSPFCLRVPAWRFCSERLLCLCCWGVRVLPSPSWPATCTVAPRGGPGVRSCSCSPCLPVRPHSPAPCPVRSALALPSLPAPSSSGLHLWTRFPQGHPVGLGWAPAGGSALGVRRPSCHYNTVCSELSWLSPPPEVTGSPTDRGPGAGGLPASLGGARVALLKGHSLVACFFLLTGGVCTLLIVENLENTEDIFK